ncbi:iron-sulfur cluster assembly scaffold protein [Sphingomicrobium sediminis]|uniref:Iron-sulfur cluster assembly scaffold protein n=1 Tax=Sphingomicrobium sediminis TaxID=2950949 RepID=A0A9X2EEB4_9SPHN|nr:iron-sulfur cluster assembly scaffold protein [Sphingomicrobium sediminis]MCM8556368.1 iron-sulfur cluster assembly scaffold protein [Sphingomicrobium sediminis]
MAAGVKPPPYTKEILRLAGALPDRPTLDPADAIVERRSESCGSTIKVSIRMDGEAIGDVAASVQACAYGQAATALMLASAKGRTMADVDHALIGIDDWLKGSDVLAPDWPGIGALAPARERPGRHGAILLPFRALAAAMKEAGLG